MSTTSLFRSFSPNLMLIILLLWLGIAVLIINYVPGLEVLELQVQTAFFRLRGQQAPPPNTIILAIDELSLSQGSFYNPKTTPYLEPIQQYPWQRIAYGKVIERLMEAGAQVVAVDVLFVQSSIYGDADDREFQKVLDKYQDRLVLAASKEFSESQEGSFEQRMSPVDIFPGLNKQVEGFVRLPTEKDRTIRYFSKTSPEELAFAQSTLDRAQIKYSTGKKSLINYLGEAGSWRRSAQEYPFYFVLDPQNWEGVLQKGKVFANKIVLIGATASSLQDIQLTPLGEMPGVEVHANALATLLTDRAIRIAFADKMSQSIFIFAWTLLISTFLKRIRKPQNQFFTAIAFSALWSILGFLLWCYGLLYLPITIAVGTAWGMGTSLLITGVFQEQLARRQIEAEKQRLRDTLELYVAAPIVSEILKQPETYYALVAGKTIAAAVMFSDIRGFTSLSRELPAQKLIQQLNIYFGNMVDAIIENEGTVDKFIGDAIMAEFGSPLSKSPELDLMSALKAALEMRKALHNLRQKWQQEGKAPFFQGIGLHFGEVIVGNIGSPRRLEYAVIGDTVNVASRVEGLTKSLGCDILLTDTIYSIMKDKINTIDLGEQELRGRSGKLRIYGLISLKGEDPSLYYQVQQDWHDHQQRLKKPDQS